MNEGELIEYMKKIRGVVSELSNWAHEVKESEKTLTAEELETLRQVKSKLGNIKGMLGKLRDSE